MDWFQCRPVLSHIHYVWVYSFVGEGKVGGRPAGRRAFVRRVFV